jgi:von Willebrand factor type A domain
MPLPATKSVPSRFASRNSLAGLLSVVMHLFLMLCGAATIRGLLPREQQESERSVSIVLVNPATEQRDKFLTSTATPSHELQSTPVLQPNPESSAQLSSALPTEETVPSNAATTRLPALDRLPLKLSGIAQAGEGLNGAPVRPVLDPLGDLETVLAEEAKRNRSTGPTGPPASVGIFGAPAAKGHSFVFVIDRSQSMGDEGLGVLHAAEKELANAIKGLQSEHRFQIIAYNDTLKFCAQRGLLKPSPESTKAVEEYLTTLTASGPTDHMAGLIAALRWQPDILFLLTDGDDPYVGEKQRERIRAAAGKTQIHCLQFGWGKPVNHTSRDCLEKLAAENNGTYTFIDMSRRK